MCCHPALSSVEFPRALVGASSPSRPSSFSFSLVAHWPEWKQQPLVPDSIEHSCCYSSRCAVDVAALAVDFDCFVGLIAVDSICWDRCRWNFVHATCRLSVKKFKALTSENQILRVLCVVVLVLTDKGFCDSFFILSAEYLKKWCNDKLAGRCDK